MNENRYSLGCFWHSSKRVCVRGLSLSLSQHEQYPHQASCTPWRDRMHGKVYGWAACANSTDNASRSFILGLWWQKPCNFFGCLSRGGFSPSQHLFAVLRVAEYYWDKLPHPPHTQPAANSKQVYLIKLIYLINIFISHLSTMPKELRMWYVFSICWTMRGRLRYQVVL